MASRIEWAGLAWTERLPSLRISRKKWSIVGTWDQQPRKKASKPDLRLHPFFFTHEPIHLRVWNGRSPCFLREIPLQVIKDRTKFRDLYLMMFHSTSGRCSDAPMMGSLIHIIYKALFCNARSLFEAWITTLRALRTGGSSSTLIWWKSSLHPRLSLSIGLSSPIRLIIIRIFAGKLPCHSDWKGLYQLELGH